MSIQEGLTMEKEIIRERLMLFGVIGFVIGILSFISSLITMNNAENFGTIRALTESIFSGLLGMTSFISGTIIFMKSIDYIP
jgi:hypothetical protein